jgi:hypothetical protein
MSSLEGAPIVDHLDHILPGEGHRIASAQVFLRLPVLGEGPRGHQILHHGTVLELVLDTVRMVHAGLLEESLEELCRRSCLALATIHGGCDMLLVGAVRFLVIIAVIVNHSCNPLRTLLSPLLAALGVLHGVLGSNIGWRRFAAAGGCFPTTWDKESFGCLLAGGVLGGDVEQFLGSVPKNVIQSPEGRWLSCVAHAALGCLWSWSLRITAVSLLIVVSTLVWVTHTTFLLHTHAPLASLVARLGFHKLGSLSQWALG